MVMGTKEKEEKKERNKMFVGVVWNCAAELKLLLTALLVLCSLATILQFVPTRFSLSHSDLRLCLSKISSPELQVLPLHQQQQQEEEKVVITPQQVLPSPPPPPPPTLPYSDPVEQDRTLDGGIIKRAFNPFGSAAYNFIHMGSYRGGLNTFAIIGLSSKPLHLYGRPTYQCEWIPEQDNGTGTETHVQSNITNTSNTTSSSITTMGYKILPDWGYGRVYTVVVVNCTFKEPVGVDGSGDGGGGRLVLHASTSGGGDRDVNSIDKIQVLREEAGSLNTSIFTSQPKYDYLYCGSSLYGNLSPQRVREWIAYHVKLFGEKSHFVIHDAGGIHPEVLEVLKPWMELGYVTLQDIRDQERFDGYYHNQFLVVNDCLHRYRFMAKWMFFFDVDEFVYVPRKSTIATILDSLSDYTQFTIEQMPMSNKLCLSADAGKTVRKWGFEKLVYRDVKRGIRRDRKYVVQPRSVFATGVHMSQNLAGKTLHKTESRIKYFHYHGTIAERREPCRQLINTTEITFEGTPYVLEDTLRKAAQTVKRFELKTIGTRLQRTRQ